MLEIIKIVVFGLDMCSSNQISFLKFDMSLIHNISKKRIKTQYLNELKKKKYWTNWYVFGKNNATANPIIAIKPVRKDTFTFLIKQTGDIFS